MYRLTATYTVELPNGFRVTRADDDPCRYAATVEGFEIAVVLVRNAGPTMKCGGDLFATRIVERVEVSVSREEGSAPPDIPINERGGRDLTDRASWFGKRQVEYRRVAVEGVNRVIQFFKYEMKTPHLRELRVQDSQFQNPRWTDSGGKEPDSGILELSVRLLTPPGPGLLGEEALTQAEDAKLQRAIQNGLIIETYREFLSDAQTSVLDNKLRRAVLEMAVACEVAVKEAFFAKATAAGAAYEYLEDKRQVHVRVIDLIDGAAKLAFGQSFKDADGSAYEQLVYLFRARNKVAHRGRMTYRDDSGEEHRVDRAELVKWWAAVDVLMKWIAKHRAPDNGDRPAD